MKLISSTVSGLGNRIKCLVGSLYLTKDVKVWWPRILDKGMMNNFRAKIEPFSDLFESDIVQIQNRVELQQLIDLVMRATWGRAVVLFLFHCNTRMAGSHYDRSIRCRCKPHTELEPSHR